PCRALAACAHRRLRVPLLLREPARAPRRGRGRAQVPPLQADGRRAARRNRAGGPGAPAARAPARGDGVRRGVRILRPEATSPEPNPLASALPRRRTRGSVAV